ncbi:MAG: methyltransferase domain-containing protein, partial [Pseudomonadota bacterium]
MGEGEAPRRSKWDDDAGRRWVALQGTVDDLFRSIECALVAGARAQAPSDVLDVGCGPGGLFRAIAAAQGPGVHCLGIDISQQMIDAAQAASPDCAFIRADAQTHRFDAGRFGRIVSRFGVMFFSDPIAAFANLRHAAAVDGALDVVSWRSLKDNPFMTVAEGAVAHLLPELSPNQDDAPGQFGLADPERIKGILSAAGWRGISVQRRD